MTLRCSFLIVCFFLIMGQGLVQAQSYLGFSLFQTKGYTGIDDELKTYQIPNLVLSHVFNFQTEANTQFETNAMYRFEEEKGFYFSGILYAGPHVGQENFKASILLGAGLEYDTWSDFIDVPVSAKFQIKIPYLVLEAGAYVRGLEYIYFDYSEPVYFLTAKISLRDIADRFVQKKILQ